jgi:predicted Rossmann-fold nucleotide-binding protein
MSKYESRIKAFEEVQEMMTTSKTPITTDTIIIGFLEQIAGSLAVIADVLAEQKDGEDDEHTD